MTDHTAEGAAQTLARQCHDNVEDAAQAMNNEWRAAHRATRAEQLAIFARHLRAFADANRPAPSPIAAAEARHAYDVAQSLREIDGAPGQEAISRIAASAPAPSAGSAEVVARPDFGEDRQEFHGTVLTCKRIAPGLTLHDLVMAFERGESEAEPGDDAAGNPSRWPVTRGVKAVTNTILDAVYGTEGRALTALPPTPLADVPEEERDAVRWALEHTIDRFPTSDGSDKLRSFITRLDPKP